MKPISRKDLIIPTISLFTSFGTLICCALPAMFVALGAGAVLAGLVSSLPFLILISKRCRFQFGAKLTTPQHSRGLLFATHLGFEHELRKQKHLISSFCGGFILKLLLTDVWMHGRLNDHTVAVAWSFVCNAPGKHTNRSLDVLSVRLVCGT